jgi:hypothetical protein
MKRPLFILVALLALAAATSLEMFRQSAGFPTYAFAQAPTRRFNCTMVSTATSLTELTNCAALTGLSYYITEVSWSSSIISTTTNFFLLESGTGTNCGTGTVALLNDFSLAFVTSNHSFPTPIKVTPAHALCFVHPGAGTRNVNVSGFIAP